MQLRLQTIVLFQNYFKTVLGRGRATQTLLAGRGRAMQTVLAGRGRATQTLLLLAITAGRW